MNSKKSLVIIAVIVIILVAVICIISRNSQEEPNVSNNGNNTENESKITEVVANRVKEKLGNAGLMLNETGRATSGLNSDGKAYTVRYNNAEEANIEIYHLSIDIRRKLGTDTTTGEKTIRNEKYWLCENVLIKLSTNETINNIIKQTIV